MTEVDLSRAGSRKCSYSSQSGNCVEVARSLPGLVAVRDSKEPRPEHGLLCRLKPGRPL
jgi:hypothetical protein